MIESETIIVGGGPAGSTCAWKLRQYGRECLLLDREPFPRTKLCGGWITPAVAADLDMDAEHYPHGLLTFSGLHVHLPGFGFTTHSKQHSIRRFEFDHWLLERSGATVYTHTVSRIDREGAHYVIDGQFRCSNLVGAGGTRCPVHRTFFRESSPHSRCLQTATLEHEFPYDQVGTLCHLWFFFKGLPGYAWYVPKADGYVNVGLGAMSAQLRAKGKDLRTYWDEFMTELRRCDLVRGDVSSPGGYSYFLRYPAGTVRSGNAFLIGDAAGLATWDLAEGIGPAVRSGILAARAIALAEPFSLDSVSSYTSGSALLSWPLKHCFIDRSGYHG